MNFRAQMVFVINEQSTNFIGALIFDLIPVKS